MCYTHIFSFSVGVYIVYMYMYKCMGVEQVPFAYSLFSILLSAHAGAGVSLEGLPTFASCAAAALP